MSLRHRESIDVWREMGDRDPDDVAGEVVEGDDGELYEEATVWNFLNVSPAYQFRGGNPTMESFTGAMDITRGGMVDGETPDYITEWVAEELWHELSLSESKLAEHFGIEVIDMESEDIHQI